MIFGKEYELKDRQIRTLMGKEEELKKKKSHTNKNRSGKKGEKKTTKRSEVDPGSRNANSSLILFKCCKMAKFLYKRKTN